MPRSSEYRRRPAEYREYQKQWQRAHADQVRLKARELHRRYREQAIALYGGKCTCCGETQYEFLAIDHVNGGGTKERRERFPNSQSFYRYVKEHHEPKKYQILCHNCNSAKGYYGVCPHQQRGGFKG